MFFTHHVPSSGAYLSQGTVAVGDIFLSYHVSRLCLSHQRANGLTFLLSLSVSYRTSCCFCLLVCVSVCSVCSCVCVRGCVRVYVRIFAFCCSHAGEVCYQWYNVDVRRLVSSICRYRVFSARHFSVPFLARSLILILSALLAFIFMTYAYNSFRLKSAWLLFACVCPP